MAFNYGTYGGTSWDERLEFVVDITMHATHDPSQNVRTLFFSTIYYANNTQPIPTRG